MAEKKVVLLNLPQRILRKTTLTLPEDQIQFLKICAGATTGGNRSQFLTMIIDTFYDEIIAFARGYALRITEMEKSSQALKATKEAVENLTGKKLVIRK